MQDPSKRKARFESLINVANLIPMADLEIESRLMTTKWFEYRFLTPIAATIEFGKQFKEAFRNYIRRNVDLDLAANVSGVSVVVPKVACREFTQLFLARQRADEFGMPYEAYLEFCFHFAERRKRKWALRPNQLHPGPDAMEAWTDRLLQFHDDEMQEYHLDYMRVPDQYRVEAFCDLPAQLALRETLRSYVSKSTKHWDDLAGKWGIQERVLPLSDFDDLSKHLTPAEVDAELKSAERSRRASIAPLAPPTVSDLWQSCHGVPGARHEATEPCSKCPQSASCAGMTSLVQRALVERYGSVSPPLRKKRDAGARRTAKSRANKKLAGAQAVAEATAEVSLG
jgi:hypothetical protein